MRALTSARLLLEAEDPNGAVDRAYYAMFHAAVAALLFYDLAEPASLPKTHSGLISSFHRHFVKDRDWNADLGRDFNEVERLRIRADYEVDVIEIARASVAVEAASKFVEGIRTTLSAKT